MTYIWPSPKDKRLRILIPLVRALARALARRDYQRDVEELKRRKSDERRASFYSTTTIDRFRPKTDIGRLVSNLD